MLAVAPLLHSQWQGNSAFGENGAFLQQANFGGVLSGRITLW